MSALQSFTFCRRGKLGLDELERTTRLPTSSPTTRQHTHPFHVQRVGNPVANSVATSPVFGVHLSAIALVLGGRRGPIRAVVGNRVACPTATKACPGSFLVVIQNRLLGYIRTESMRGCSCDYPTRLGRCRRYFDCDRCRRCDMRPAKRVAGASAGSLGRQINERIVDVVQLPLW
jgi:hypothetical protein